MDIERIEDIIDNFINPKLLEHKGWLDLESFADGVAVIRFRGACNGCGGIRETLDEFVIPTLRTHAPDIQEVQVNEGVSQELYDLAISMLSKN